MTSWICFYLCLAYAVRKVPGKDSIRLGRKTAGWDDEYLASLIAA